MRAGVVAGVAAVALMAAGCSLVTPVAEPVVPTFPATTTTAAPPPAPVKAGLPKNCNDLIEGKQLDDAVGLPLSGVVRTVIGQPSPSVGLIGRVSCSFGIPSPSGGYALELSLTSYRDEEAAAARVPINVEALRTPGVDPLPIKIGRMTAMYLPLRDGPMLIGSTGVYSITVILGPTSFSPDEAPARAAAVAGMALSGVRA